MRRTQVAVREFQKSDDLDLISKTKTRECLLLCQGTQVIGQLSDTSLNQPDLDNRSPTSYFLSLDGFICAYGHAGAQTAQDRFAFSGSGLHVPLPCLSAAFFAQAF